jgi:hypothetical protein
VTFCGGGGGGGGVFTAGVESEVVGAFEAMFDAPELLLFEDELSLLGVDA